MKKLRLIAGTINAYQDDNDWHNILVDASSRGVYDPIADLIVQPHIVTDIVSMPVFRSDMFDEIRCHHVLEHLSMDNVLHALREFYRVLKTGGAIDVETPDMDAVAQAWANQDYTYVELQQWIHGEDLGDCFDGHRSSWNPTLLNDVLVATGFNNVNYHGEGGLAVRYTATK